MSDGIFAFATRTPLNTPHASPDTIEAAMPSDAVPQPSPPCHIMTLAPTTPEKTITDPIDRSMPAVMITNVIPTPRIARMDAFWTIRRMLPTLANVFGLQGGEHQPDPDEHEHDLERLHADDAGEDPVGVQIHHGLMPESPWERQSTDVPA